MPQTLSLSFADAGDPAGAFARYRLLATAPDDREFERRERLDHVVAFSERHLRRPLRDYVSYYHAA